MKRKLLILTLGILVFACLFATSIFATVNYEETVVLADGTTLPIYDEEHNPLIWYVSGIDAEGKNIYKSMPNNRNEADENNNDYVTYTINTSWMTQLQDVNFHIYNGSGYDVVTEKEYDVVVLNLRGLTSFEYINNGLGYESIQYIYMNEVLKDFCDLFQRSQSLRLVDLSVCTDLSGGFGGVCNLQECINLHTIRLAPGTSYSLKCNSNRNYRFKNTAITEIVIPANITNLGIDNFNNCQKLESIYILGNSTSLGQRNFAGCTNLTNIYILGDNPTIDITSFKENFYECVNAGQTLDFKQTGKYFFFVTTNEEYLNQVKEAIGASEIVSYSSYVANPSSYVEGRYIISGTNICDVYYKTHVLDENSSNSCAGICTVCGEIAMSNNPIHDYKTTVVYSNYLENGIKIQTCQNSNCIHNTDPQETSLSPLFTCLGYTVREYGNAGIAIGFVVNHDSIETYENETGKTVNYGLFAVSKSKAGSNTVFDENGALLDGAIRTDLTGRGYDLFELRITGFTEESHKTAEIAMGGFVAVADENGTTYSYMQAGTPQEGAVYEFVSYNGIVGTPSTNEDTAQ